MEEKKSYKNYSVFNQNFIHLKLELYLQKI
jgi:hypothetical protein